MVPGYDCAASVLLCAEDNAAILGLDEEGEESSWAAAATPPRDTVAAAAATGVAVDGFLPELPLLSDDYVASLVEREVEHMAAEGYPQKLQRRHGDLDLAAVRKDAVDWIWKVSSLNRSMRSFLCDVSEMSLADLLKGLLFRVYRGS